MKNYICFLILFVSLLAVFEALVYLVRKYTGCKKETAIKKVRCFFSGQPEDPIKCDSFFVDTLLRIIKSVIGESRFNERKMAEDDLPIICFRSDYCPPAIQVAIICADEHEKKRLSTLLARLLTRTLRAKGLCTEYLMTWEMDEELDMPYLQVRYATNADQEEQLLSMKHDRVSDYLNTNRPVVDDTEDDLHG